MRKAVSSQDLRLLVLGSLALVVFLCLAWRHLLLQGQVPIDGNVIAVSYPNWRLSRTLWTEPHLPLWNPWRNMGIPHLADPITSAGYPLLWLLSAQSRFVDFMRSWVVLHTLIAGLFMGAFVWRWSRDPPASAAAGIIYAFNAFFMEKAVFPHCFAAQAWLPAVLYFQHARNWVGLGVCFALQWLAGYPSFTLLSVLAVFCLAAATGRTGLRCFIKGGVLALALSAFQLLPFLELFALSARSAVLDPAFAAQFSVPLSQMLKMLLLPQWTAFSPQLSGDPAIVGFYVGPFVLIASIYALHRGCPWEKRLAAGAALCLLFGLGSHLPGYRYLFFLHFFRFPAHWFLLATIALTVLAASGIAKCRSAKMKWAIVAGIALDLVLFAQHNRVVWGQPAFLNAAPALVRTTRRLRSPSRIYHTEHLMRTWQRATLEAKEDYWLLKDFLAPSYGMAFGLQDTINLQTMRLKSGEAYRRRLASAPRDSPLLDWAGIGLIIGLDPGARRVERGSFKIASNKDAKPRIFIAGGEKGKAELLDYGPGRASASVDLPHPVRLVFAEAHYPGWRASMDGIPVDIERFEEFFISARIPAGKHKVVFRFRPASFYFGLAISLFALGFLLARRSLLRNPRRHVGRAL